MRRRFIVAAALLLGLGAVLGWAFSRPREPMYKGKPLSFWLQRSVGPNRNETSVHAALDTLGTNAIPVLLRWMEAKDSPLKVRVMALATNQHFVRVQYIPAWQKHRIALLGLARVGQSGASVIPAIVDVYKRDIPQDSREDILLSFSMMGSAASDAVPMLVALPLKDANADMRNLAAMTLGLIHANAEVAIPALIQGLNDPDAHVRRAMVNAIGDFDGNSQPAIPVLKGLLNDNDYSMRQAASNALKKIDKASPLLLRP